MGIGSLGINRTHDEMLTMFKEVDIDDNEELTFDEFIELLKFEARSQHLAAGWPLEKLSYKVFGFKHFQFYKTAKMDTMSIRMEVVEQALQAVCKKLGADPGVTAHELEKRLQRDEIREHAERNVGLAKAAVLRAGDGPQKEKTEKWYKAARETLDNVLRGEEAD